MKKLFLHGTFGAPAHRCALQPRPAEDDAEETSKRCPATDRALNEAEQRQEGNFEWVTVGAENKLK